MKIKISKIKYAPVETTIARTAEEFFGDGTKIPAQPKSMTIEINDDMVECLEEEINDLEDEILDIISEKTDSDIESFSFSVIRK